MGACAFRPWAPAAGQQPVEGRLLGGDRGVGGVDLGGVGRGIERRQQVALLHRVAFLDAHAFDAPWRIEGEVGLADVGIAVEHDFAGRRLRGAPEIEIGVAAARRDRDDDRQRDQPLLPCRHIGILAAIAVECRQCGVAPWRATTADAPMPEPDWGRGRVEDRAELVHVVRPSFLFSGPMIHDVGVDGTNQCPVEKSSYCGRGPRRFPRAVEIPAAPPGPANLAEQPTCSS